LFGIGGPLLPTVFVFPAAPRLSGGSGGGAELTNPFVSLLTIGGFGCPGLSLTGGAGGAELPPALDDPAPGGVGPGLPAEDDPFILLAAGGGGGAAAPPRL
jgi:hypothetical protein